MADDEQEKYSFVFAVRSNSGRQHKPDLTIYFLKSWSLDKKPSVNLIELGKMHVLVLDTLSYKRL
jgi:hypothetical protein